MSKSKSSFGESFATGELVLISAAPVESDARTIMEWRNDPVTLSMFYHRAPKVWDEFWLEFREDYFTDPVLPPLFAVYEGRRIAFLRFKRVKTNPYGVVGLVADISINVAPEERGRGWGKRVLRLASLVMRRAGVDWLLAEVRRENQASRQIFEAAGYWLVEETERFIPDTGELAAIWRFLIPISSKAKKDEDFFSIL